MSVLMTPDGRIPVVLFGPDASEHLRLLHGLTLPPGVPFDVLTRVHQASHFTAALGRTALRVPHWHSIELTERLAEQEARVEAARVALMKARAGLDPTI